MMKKTFIPFAALALMTLVACGGGTKSSSSSSGKSSEPATSSVTSSAPSSSSQATSEGTSSAVESSSEIESSAEVESSSEVESESSSEPITVSVSIANKEALQAEWHVKDANRTIELNLEPRTNILAALDDGTLTITSSNEEVVKVSGKNAMPVGVGEATITVTYLGESDSVAVTVEDALVEPDYASKTLTEVMAVEDLVTVGNNSYGHEAYLTQVKVGVLGNKADGSAAADQYGNMFVSDPADNSAEPALIQVYGAGASISALNYEMADKIYKYANAKDFLTNADTKDIKVGDVLDVIAIRADYKQTKEISVVIRAVNGKLISNGARTTDEVNATADSANVRKQLITVKGKITGWQSGKDNGGQYGNFYLQTDGSTTDPVYVYGASATETAIELLDTGALKFNNPKDFLTNEATKDLNIGDEITLLGFRCDYNGTLELTGVILTDGEDPVDPPVVESEPDYASKTLTEMMAVEDLVTVGNNSYGHEAYLTQVKVGVLGNKADGSAAADQFGNMFVSDPTDNSAEPALIQVYGAGASISALGYEGTDKIYKYTNARDFLTNEETKDIKVGDVLDVIAIRADYKTTKEISMVIRAINGKLISNGARTTDEVNATADSANVRKQLITVRGKITGWKAGSEDATKYGNFYLQTEGSTTDSVYVYGATASEGKISLKDDLSLKFTNPQDFLTNAGTKDLTIGDEVTLLGFRCDYNGTLELTGQILTDVEPQPVEYKTSISAITEANEPVKLDEVTVAAVNNKALVVTDGTAGLYVYLNAAPTVAVGDVVSVEGTSASYHGYLQLGSGATVTKLEGKTPVALTPTALTADIADGWASANFSFANAGLYTWTATAGKAGNYFTLNIEGSETVIEPVYYNGTLEEGKTYDVTAYYYAYDSDKSYAAVVITSITAKGGEVGPQEKQLPATFDLGPDGEAAHAEGSSGKTSYTETVNGYTLSISDGVKLATNARDATGKGCLKLGSSNDVGSFKVTVPEDVATVRFEIAGYKANDGQVIFNEGETLTVTSHSNDGSYELFEISPVEGVITLATGNSGKRVMINSITFLAAEPV